MGDTLKLDNKGFAISSIMYIILVLAVILISLILVTLSSRKLILDKLREEVLTTIYEAPNITYRQTIKELKNEAIAYMTDNSLEKESIKIDELSTSIDIDALEKYKLNDKYLTAVKNTDSYNVYLGKSNTITNTTKLPKNTIDIVDYKIYGNSYQQTYSGKNLFNINNLKHGYGDVEYTILENKVVLTSVETTGVQYVSNFIYELDETKEYVLSFKSKKIVKGTGNYSNISISIYGSNNNVDYEPIKDVSKTNPGENVEYSLTTVVTGYSSYKMYIYNNNSTPVIIGEKTEYYDIQFEEGNTATSYEPYVGGIASPNLDYPQDIQSVGLKTNNLLNPNTVEDVNKYVDAWSGNLYTSSTTTWRSSDFIAIVGGNIYYFNAINSNASAAGIAWYDENKNYISGQSTTTVNQNNGKITAPSNASYLRVSWIIDVGYNNDWRNTVQLKEETKGIEYEPYGYNIPIKTSGNNLFDSDYNFTGYNAYGLKIDYLENENCFVINGTATAAMIFAERWVNIPIIKGENFSISSRYVSGTITKPNTTDYAVAYFGASDAINTSNNWNNASLAENDKIKENIKCNYDYITKFWFFISAGVSFDNYKVKIQLEKGNKTTEYEKYVEPQTTNIYLDEPLRKISSNADSIIYKDKMLNKNISSIILTDEEGVKWYYWETSKTENTMGVYYNNPEVLGVYKSPKFKNLIGFSNYFKLITKAVNLQNDSLVGGMYFAPGSDPPYISFKVPYTNLTEWRNHLKELNENGKPLEVVYELIETEEKDIALPRINVSEGASIIEFDTDIKPSEYEFTAIEKIMEI